MYGPFLPDDVQPVGISLFLSAIVIPIEDFTSNIGDLVAACRDDLPDLETYAIQIYAPI